MNRRRQTLGEWITTYGDEILPLIRENRIDEAILRVERELSQESDREVRSWHFANLTSFLAAAGRHDECLGRAQQRVDEFPQDPLAWKTLASCFHSAFHRPDNQPTQEEKEEALRCWRRALDVAKTEKAWVRTVAFSFCRGLAEWKMWSELEVVMAEILQHLKGKPCDNDTFNLEGEWIEKIPVGTVDPLLIDDYKSALRDHAERTKQMYEEMDRKAAEAGENIYTFEAHAKTHDGTTAPFLLHLSQPTYDERGGFYCRVECPFLGERPFLIYGVDGAQAGELSIGFIRNSLRHEGVTITDESGNELPIPDLRNSQ